MANAILVDALTWLHIFSVVGWFGAAMVFLMVVEPSLPNLSPQTNGELVLKLFPRFVRFVQTFATLALVFGISLALAISDGDLALFGVGSTWGMYVSIGASFGIATFLLVFLLLAPSVKELGRLVVQMQQNPGQPPTPEFHKAQELLKYGAPAAVVLLSLAMVFMVAAAGV
ncbi:MAG: hypothetical protein JRN12_06275 [Nitrososphaerota archaeon]|nr:hypothetical protein [Nitrososphaerota archaeon]MDG6954629.1 hypothetical protein [Nitrososphaerota archaeon]